jgi:hypothetical protein
MGKPQIIMGMAWLSMAVPNLQTFVRSYFAWLYFSLHESTFTSDDTVIWIILQWNTVIYLLIILNVFDTEFTSHVSHYLACCTSPGWWMMMMMMMSVEQSVEWVAGETEVLREKLAQCCFVHHKPHITWPGLESRSPQWEASDYLPELWHGQCFLMFQVLLLKKHSKMPDMSEGLY